MLEHQSRNIWNLHVLSELTNPIASESISHATFLKIGRRIRGVYKYAVSEPTNVDAFFPDFSKILNTQNTVSGRWRKNSKSLVNDCKFFSFEQELSILSGVFMSLFVF
jgi:hypothetical protein